MIAIVDDDAAVRAALADLVEVLGFEVRDYDSSESFLAAHAPGLFGCLITDLELPGESGLQLRRRLAEIEPALPVIILSARADPAARDQALSCGATAYLEKPINDKVLLRHITTALAGPEPQA